MALIGRYPEYQLRFILAFIDYMATKKVKLRLQGVIQEEFGQEVKELQLSLIESPMDIDVEEELKLFWQNPEDPKYFEASWQEEAINSKEKPLVQYPPFSFFYKQFITQIKANSGSVTISILILNIIIFIFGMAGFSQMIFNLLHFPERSTEWIQIWRLWSPAFFHIEPYHILSNLVMFWFFVGAIEKQQGKNVVLFLVVISALIANITQFTVSGFNFLGLSGVVYAGLGYRIGYSFNIAGSNERHPLRLQPGISSIFIIFMLINLLQPLQMFNIYIGNASHISGLIIGFLLSMVIRFLIKVDQ